MKVRHSLISLLLTSRKASGVLQRFISPNLSHASIFHASYVLIRRRVGVAPEKSIKLVVNSFFRGKLTNPETGGIAFSSEIFSGGFAGLCQVLGESQVIEAKAWLTESDQPARGKNLKEPDAQT